MDAVSGGGRVPLALAAGAAVWGVRHACSPAVRRWRAGAGRSVRAGPLQVRTFGSGSPVVVLLHGMAGAGNSFGAAFDRLGGSARVVVPDLLGFGGSMVAPGPVTGEDHLTALDSMLAALGLAGKPLVVAGHSMGGAVALRFAARHRDLVRGVVTFCAALYRDAAEADGRVALMLGRAAAVLAGDGPLPQKLCGWMCRYRTAASWVAVAARPDLPVPVARAGVMHTWDSYRGALNGLLRTPEWEPALARLKRQMCRSPWPRAAATRYRCPAGPPRSPGPAAIHGRMPRGRRGPRDGVSARSARHRAVGCRRPRRHRWANPPPRSAASA